MRKIVNISVASLVLLVFILWIYNDSSLLLLIPVFIVYLTLLIIASTNIRLGYFIKSYCKAKTTTKEIVLTFDDGPVSEHSAKLIELLDDFNVKATFFCVGEKVKANPEIIRLIHEKGHIIGNHTYYHSRYFDLFSSFRMINEINFTNNEIYKLIGKQPLLFRPPYGVTNPLLKKALRKTGMKSIGWSLRSFDTILNEDKVFNKLLKKTSPGDIVLFHDNLNGVQKLLKRYLVWLKENSFNVVSLTQMLNIKAYEE